MNEFSRINLTVKKNGMVEVFKTDVTKREIAEKVVKDLTRQFPATRINFDLEDCDKVLRVEGDMQCFDLISNYLAERGYTCEKLSE